MTNEERRSAKNCPDCGQPLEPRASERTGEEQLGCSNWPQCDYTEPLPEDMLLRRQNHPELPGMPGMTPGPREL